MQELGLVPGAMPRMTPQGAAILAALRGGVRPRAPGYAAGGSVDPYTGYFPLTDSSLYNSAPSSALGTAATPGQTGSISETLATPAAKPIPQPTGGPYGGYNSVADYMTANPNSNITKYILAHQTPTDPFSGDVGGGLAGPSGSSASTVAEPNATAQPGILGLISSLAKGQTPPATQAIASAITSLAGMGALPVSLIGAAANYMGAKSDPTTMGTVSGLGVGSGNLGVDNPAAIAGAQSGQLAGPGQYGPGGTDTSGNSNVGDPGPSPGGPTANVEVESLSFGGDPAGPGSGGAGAGAGSGGTGGDSAAGAGDGSAGGAGGGGGGGGGAGAGGSEGNARGGTIGGRGERLLAALRRRNTSGPIKGAGDGKTDTVALKAKPGAYILPADTVAALGGGNTNAGHERLSARFGGAPQASSAPGGTPITAASGEFKVDPGEVARVGGGDHKRGAAHLDHMVMSERLRLIKALLDMPMPKGAQNVG